MSDADPSPERPPEDAEPSLSARLGRAVVPGVVRRNYGVKFALALLLVVLLIAAIGGVSYLQIQGIIEEDAERTLRSTASVQSEGLAEWVDGMESQTRAVAASDVYGTQNREQIRTHLVDSRQLVGDDVVAAHYVDPNGSAGGASGGEIVASTERDYGRAPVTTVARAWSTPIDRVGESGSTPIATSRTYERNGELLLAFVRPVRYGDGVVVVEADVRSGFDRLHDAEIVSTTTVVDEEGREVTAPRQSTPVWTTRGMAFDRALDGETAIEQYDSDVVAFAAVDGVDWVVVAEAPTAELYQASGTVGQNVAVLVASTLVVLGIVGIVLGRGTVLPVIRLRKRAEELAAGNFDVDLRTGREDEIGRLFVAFEHMRDALHEQISETEAARDRAERSRNEIARQNERLEQFASTLSHDLRNPLTVADGHRDLLEMELDGDADPDVLRDHVDVIDESHDRMQAIITDVLELARTGATIDDPGEIGLESIATEAWSNVDHGDARLEVVGTRSFPADRGRLLRAFENLYRNAVEHGSTSTDEDPGDEPDVAVEVGPTDDGFYVADDGPGIPPEAVDDVFEYGHSTTADGTGFGLAIVEAIVAAHGWSIEVDEDYEDGAKFVISGTVEGEQ